MIITFPYLDDYMPTAGSFNLTVAGGRWDLIYTMQYAASQNVFDCGSECSRIKVCASFSFNPTTFDCRLAWAPSGYNTSGYMVVDSAYNTYDLMSRTYLA